MNIAYTVHARAGLEIVAAHAELDLAVADAQRRADADARSGSFAATPHYVVRQWEDGAPAPFITNVHVYGQDVTA